MLRDAGGGFWGALVFALAMFSPGYCIGQWIHPCGFRSRGLREQLAWSLALSFGPGTLVLVAAAWLTGVSGAAWILAAFSVAAIFLWRRHPPRMDIERREAVVAALLASAWILVVLASLVDVGLGSRLWMSVTVYDHSVRTAFVGAVMRSGVPPLSPFYWPGHGVSMRYYYFWYVTCAVVARIAHISARQALIASCVWPPLGVAAMIALFGRYLLNWRGRLLRSCCWLGVALLAVTGLDLLVSLFNGMTGNPFFGDMEWWSIDQVTSWTDTFLWVPHHAAALCACLCGTLLLWMGSREQQTSSRWKMGIVAGLSFAAAFGLSSYVAVGAAIVIGSWVVWRLLYEDGWRALSTVAVAAATAILTLLPYLAQLLKHASGKTQSAGATSVLAFGVRQILSPSILSAMPGLQSLHAHHPFAETQIAALILLVPGYLVELGFFAAVLLLAQGRYRDRTPGETTLLFWTWSGLASASFLRSHVIATNDYGMRATLLPQFFLLLLAVLVLRRSSGWFRKSLLALAVIGVAGSAYQVVMLRMFLPWHESHGDPAMRELAERNYALRDADEALRRRVSANARVQYDLAPTGYFSNAQMLNTSFQIIAADSGCDASFGGDASLCPPIQSRIGQLFPSGSGPFPATPAAVSLCTGLGAQFLVATRWDPVWSDREDWVWHLPVAVQRPSVRILACEQPGSQ